ncbi:peroxisomal dehydratase [Multifurca ochricompacta]|uniref:Peroxisomal dehydratase n=1 Tax=Multifurca ochricompacta TaxID=376703 RepID=A0AAD4LYM3_9AGAM|nr:peroxisomal dehydratase [Multifurca ochricompacta]
MSSDSMTTVSSHTLQRIVGREYGADPVSWNRRDLLAYALGIGATPAEQQFVNGTSAFPPCNIHFGLTAERSPYLELHPSFAAFPTFPVVLFLKGKDDSVTEFTNTINRTNAIKGLPYFDPSHLVHATQSIEILKPLHLSRLISIRENKSGVILENEFILVDPEETPYARLTTAMFNLTGKITGQRYTRSVVSLPEAKPIPRDRAPNWVVADRTNAHQALMYRLSGDYNPLHVDPNASSSGGGVILHGLSTLGFAARALIRTVGYGRPSSLQYLNVRFTAPVTPGDGLETSAWDVGSGPGGVIEVAFEVRNTRTGKVGLVIGGGHARFARWEPSKL